MLHLSLLSMNSLNKTQTAIFTLNSSIASVASERIYLCKVTAKWEFVKLKRNFFPFVPS